MGLILWNLNKVQNKMGLDEKAFLSWFNTTIVINVCKIMLIIGPIAALVCFAGKLMKWSNENAEYKTYSSIWQAVRETIILFVLYESAFLSLMYFASVVKF